MNIFAFFLKKKTWVACFAVLFVCLAILASYVIVGSMNSQIVSAQSALNTIPKKSRVGIVFGGGIGVDGVPTPLVQERLDAAQKLLDDGVVERLILSGDNRFVNYNEPAAMRDYLISTYDTSPVLLQEDFAGRSTYETCERANKVFGLSEAVLVSQETHLPRAVFLCEHFGVDSHGVIADGPASRSQSGGQTVREVLARTKAVFNAYLIGEQTLLGDPIELSPII